MRRLWCAIALAVSCWGPAAAMGPDDPAAIFYKRCVGSPRKVGVPDQGCDRLINDGLTGIIVGQFNQENPAFCLPKRLEAQMWAVDGDRREHWESPSADALRAKSNLMAEAQAEMRAAVARYMREHPERLSEKTLVVILAALLQSFPCPG